MSEHAQKAFKALASLDEVSEAIDGLKHQIAALEADNAALLEALRKTRDELDEMVGIRAGEALRRVCADNHPGATLLEEHRRALEDGREERDRLHATLLEEGRWAVFGRAAAKALEPYAKPEGEDFEACFQRALTKARNDALEDAAKQCETGTTPIMLNEMSLHGIGVATARQLAKEIRAMKTKEQE